MGVLFGIMILYAVSAKALPNHSTLRCAVSYHTASHVHIGVLPCHIDAPRYQMCNTRCFVPNTSVSSDCRVARVPSDPSQHPLRSNTEAAYLHGDFAVLQRLLDARAKVDATEGNGFSALMAASLGDRHRAVQQLVSNKASLEQCTGALIGRRALHCAALTGAVRMPRGTGVPLCHHRPRASGLSIQECTSGFLVSLTVAPMRMILERRRHFCVSKVCA